MRIASEIGVEAPIPRTASGRLLVGHMSDDEIRAFIPQEEFTLPDGRTLSVADFLADVAKARRQDYCETTGLADRFTWCMAAPIRRRPDHVELLLCLVLSVNTPKAKREALLALLRARTFAVDRLELTRGSCPASFPRIEREQTDRQQPKHDAAPAGGDVDTVMSEATVVSGIAPS